MTQLTKKETVTSLELLKEINFFREKEDKTELGHNDLLKVIRDEFEEEISRGKISQSNYYSRGKEYPMFNLTLGQAKQVLSRESKYVRKAVIQYIENLEEKLKEIIPQLSEMEMIIKIAEKHVEHDKKFIEIENKIDGVINTVTIPSLQQTILQRAINSRVYHLFFNTVKNSLGSIEEDKKYQRETTSKMFKNIHRDIRKKFGVPTYRDVKQLDYEKALNFIEQWIEDVI